jgi:hypothetical protein
MNPWLAKRELKLQPKVFYSPYVPLIQTPVVLDPNVFMPRKGLLTRYGKKQLEENRAQEQKDKPINRRTFDATFASGNKDAIAEALYKLCELVVDNYAKYRKMEYGYLEAMRDDMVQECVLDCLRRIPRVQEGLKRKPDSSAFNCFLITADSLLRSWRVGTPVKKYEHLKTKYYKWLYETNPKMKVSLGNTGTSVEISARDWLL